MREGAIIAGKYRLRRLIGEGAVGEVWAALNERTEREVALKLIVGADRELRERAIREARACGRVAHRNVVEIFDAGETDHGDPFLVMQLLDGETVSDRLKRERRLPPRRAAAIALDVARGLAAAHAAGIVHRDLKPSNIFLHREQEPDRELVKVLDFGVSKMLWSGGPPTTRTGDIVGSPAYMSPEQARADRALDHRTDLWSLGVVLFEMLTGERPFPSRNIGVISEIVSAPIPSPIGRVPDLDPRLAVVVARCLERDLDRRVQTAGELVAMLRPCADVEDIWGTADSWRRVPSAPAAMPDASEEDLIPTLALGNAAASAVLSAALDRVRAAQATAAPAAQPFRPVPITLTDPSRPQPGPSRAPMDTQDDIEEEMSTAQMDKSPLAGAALPRPATLIQPPGATPSMHAAAARAPAPHKKTTGALLLVGAIGTVLTLAVVVLASMLIRHLFISR